LAKSERFYGGESYYLSYKHDKTTSRAKREAMALLFKANPKGAMKCIKT